MAQHTTISDNEILELLALPPVKWDAWVESQDGVTRHHVERTMASIAVTAARWSRYIEARSYRGEDHQAGVRLQNQAAGKVRAALGFSQHRDDINF